MKKNIKTAVSTLLIIICLICFVSCSNSVDRTGLWENATYIEDVALGTGAKTFVLQVEAEEKIVTFTVETDKNTVGDALLEQKLINGDQGEYGLYVKIVNGITADYEKDKSYWAFYVDGEYATSGVDTTEIREGATYKLERTK